MKVVCIAGTKSSIGKTTVSMLLTALFKEKGYNVQTYKVGPDFIDTAYHQKISGKRSINLDLYMRKNKIIDDFLSGEGDIGIVEGVMGLYDGVGAKSDYGSTAHICRILNLPIILVLDASASSRSVAAEFLGFKSYSPESNIVGAVLNRVHGNTHLNMLQQAIGKDLLGYVFENKQEKIVERHLGLLPVYENNAFSIKGMLNSAQFDFKKIMKIAKDVNMNKKKNKKNKFPVLDIAYDQVFNFYYTQNLKLLSEYFDIRYFSPLADKTVSGDALYVGGGFPEVFLKELSLNYNIKTNIKKKIEDGLPVYAECGGLMYLSKSIESGMDYPMVGIFDGKVKMGNSLKIGYTKISVVKENPIMSKREVVRGQVFHYADFSYNENLERTYNYMLVTKKEYVEGGFTVQNALADFNHIFLNEKMVRRFQVIAEKYSKK